MISKPKHPKRLLSVSEAASYLNLSRHYLYNRIAPGSKDPFPVQPIRVGRAVRFDIHDLDAFIEKQKAMHS